MNIQEQLALLKKSGVGDAAALQLLNSITEGAIGGDKMEKGLNSIKDAVGRQYEEQVDLLTKGLASKDADVKALTAAVLAQGEQVSHLVKALGTFAEGSVERSDAVKKGLEDASGLVEKVDVLTKSIESFGAQGVTTPAVVASGDNGAGGVTTPAPGDGGNGKEPSKAEQLKKSMNLSDRLNAAIRVEMEKTKQTKNRTRSRQLVKALGDLTSNVPADQIAQKYNITLS